MKVLYVLWMLNPDPHLQARGVWFSNPISCEISMMEAAADTGRNLKEFSCVAWDGRMVQS